MAGALLLAAALAWTLYPAGTQAAGLRCTLTGKEIKTCCCTQKDGASTFAQRGEPQSNHKLYCPLAKKSIETCCCVPAGQAR